MRLVAAVLVALLLSAAPASAAEKKAPRERTFLVHVQTLLDGKTDRTILVPRVIAAALKQGYHVVLLFDGDGVRTLKMGRWFGGHSTPIDRVQVMPQDRRDLAVLLNTTPYGVPDIYGSLLHFFRGRGVAIYVSKRALELRSIGPDHFDHTAEAVGEDHIVELLASAGAYAAY